MRNLGGDHNSDRPNAIGLHGKLQKMPGVAAIVGKMPEQHKRFLISVERGEPDWALFDLSGAKDLPAVQ
jgi:hypothetical protein